MDIQEIKQRLSIITVLSGYGILPDKSGHVRCPFHEDNKPSCRIYPDTGTYYCFGCGAKGDQVQFIQDKEGISKHEALKKAKTIIGAGIIERASKKHQVQMNYQEIFQELQKSFPRSQRAVDYLLSRGLEGNMEVGYNSGMTFKKLKNCVVFPLKDKTGHVSGLYGRSIHENGPSKHYYTANRQGLYPCYPSSDTCKLLVTESVIDAATLMQLKALTEEYTILTAYGTNGLVSEIKQTIVELKNLREVVFFFDGDASGRQGVSRYAGELKAMLPGVKITSVIPPEGEDVNSLFVKQEGNYLLTLVNESQAVPTFFSNEFSIEKKETGKAPEPFLDTSQANKLIYESFTARYIVKGGPCRQLDKLLVSLDVQHLETGVKYRCRVDLYEERQTRKEAREASDKLDARSDLIENDLSFLTDLLEEYRESQMASESREESKREKPVLASWQTRCMKLLGSKNLLDDLQTVIKQTGVVGEEKNILLLYLCSFSYKMGETLHVVIQGSSGSGKTTLLSKASSFMPPERVIKFTRVTEGSFYNYDEYFFRGMHVSFEDLDGLKPEALLAVRELISNEVLVSSTTMKDEQGNLRARPRIVRGPMASVSATTNGDLYEDNESRVLVISVDEGREQTRRVITYQQKKAVGEIDHLNENESTELMQNLTRMLHPYPVLNPYADKIQLPGSAQKLRRLSRLFLALVKQVTLLHQYQRKKTSDGKLITSKQDVRDAIEILFDTIVLKTDELDGSLRQFFEQLKEWVSEQGNQPEGYEFTRREVRHALQVSNTQLHRFIDKLKDLEYIRESGGYHNRGLKYSITWWDDYLAFRARIKNDLLQQLDDLP